MQAVKQIVRPDKYGRITIELPTEFRAEEVEVIVLQYSNESNQGIRASDSPFTEEQKLLLAFPVATEEDLAYIEEKRRHLNEWK